MMGQPSNVNHLSQEDASTDRHVHQDEAIQSINDTPLLMNRSRLPTSKSTWSEEEDMRLARLVTTYGAKNWSRIAQALQSRSGKQCRERWRNHLNPEVSKEPFNQEEDALIVSMVELHGTKWAKIAKSLVGRTDNAVKNRYNSSLRKAHERRKRKDRPQAQQQDEHSVQSKEAIAFAEGIGREVAAAVGASSAGSNTTSTAGSRSVAASGTAAPSIVSTPASAIRTSIPSTPPGSPSYPSFDEKNSSVNASLSDFAHNRAAAKVPVVKGVRHPKPTKGDVLMDENGSEEEVVSGEEQGQWDTFLNWACFETSSEHSPSAEGRGSPLVLKRRKLAPTSPAVSLYDSELYDSESEAPPPIETGRSALDKHVGDFLDSLAMAAVKSVDQNNLEESNECTPQQKGLIFSAAIALCEMRQISVAGPA